MKLQLDLEMMMSGTFIKICYTQQQLSGKLFKTTRLVKRQSCKMTILTDWVHKCYFIEDISRRDEFIKKLSKEGFDYAEDITHEEGYIGFSFTRIDNPYYYEIDNITSI